MKNIILIDGHNLLFRMFYGIPASIKNTQGKEIKGLIGFIGSIKKIIEKFNPYKMIVVFDSETSKNNNLKLNKEYKANRIDYTNIPVEENPFSQLPLIKKALDYLNINYIEVENYEADDFIASIITKMYNKNYRYIIISTDTDFIQLINKNVFLYVPRGKHSILYDKKQVIKKYNITPEKYILFKSLVGDKSDNIKGITGIGYMRAAQILKYHSLQDFISNNKDSKYANLLVNNEENIEKNKILITLNKTLDISKIRLKKISKKIQFKTYEIIANIGER